MRSFKLPRLTRRQALQAGTVTVAGLLAGIESGSAAEAAPAASVRRSERSFDDAWRFFRGDVTGGERAAFDDSSWRVLDLPHDWSIEDLPGATSEDGGATSDPSLLVFRSGAPPQPTPPALIGPFDQQAVGGGSTGYMVGGIAWYRKRFALPELSARGIGRDRHVELRFDGVYQNADVWLNGTHLGFHPYGYTPFAFDLTPHLDREGANVLAVRVDNSDRTRRWYSGSGIYRHTWLTVTGPLRVPLWGVSVTTPAVGEDRSSVHVEVALANLGASPSTARVRVTVLDRHGRRVAAGETAAAGVAAGGTAAASVDLSIERPALWSPESPSLYTARADVLAGDAVVDSAATTFGIRSIEWNGTAGLLLNGRPVKALGGCVHDTHGPLGAVALDRTEERRVELLKAAGFNAIRTAHNPPAPALLDACDRLGMLVMDEFTDVWDKGKNPQDYSVHFPQWWPQDLTSMVLRDRNHPSVVIWSLGNEIPEDPNYASRGPQLAALLRSLDATRPITLGGGSTFGAGDASWQYVDIGDVHYNANGQTYGPIHAAHPERPMTQSESFPSAVFDDRAFIEANPWAIGNWVWTAVDYLGEAGLGKTPVAPAGTSASFPDQTTQPGWSNAGAVYFSVGGFGFGYPWFQANCGDIDLIGQRKPQSHWRAAAHGLSPVEVLVARPTPAGTEQEAVWWGYFDEEPSWTWDAAPRQPMTVHVYTPGDSVRLLQDGVAVPGGDVAPARAKATFTVPYRPGELTAIASRNGREIGRRTLVTAGAPARLRLTSDVDELTTSRDALAHVLVEVVDGRGRRVPAVVPVTFEVGGAGELAGVANGNPHNIDSFRRPQRLTWHGQAQAILRPARTPGRLTLVARAPGLRPATVSLRVGPER